MITFADVEAARRRIGDHIYKTPCAYTQTLSEHTGTQLYLKLENLQMTGSFKERGACNKIETLTAEERACGVVASSAGNHAQGVAYHARRAGIDATIVMPLSTPLVKVAATRRFGANVVLHGTNYDAAYEEALRIREESGAVLVHPFDDPAVIAGQGTIGLELIEQNPYLDAIVVAVGGGGLAAGIAVAVKETNPRVKVYGVETKALPSMRAALDAGGPVTIDAAETLADGIAVRRVGTLTHELAARYLDDVVTVSDEEIAEAILRLLEDEKTMAEGAGAAPLAAVLHRRLPLEGKRVGVVVCGGNIDFYLLSRIIERGLVQSGRLFKIALLLPDVPGALERLAGAIAAQRGNIVQIDYERAAATARLGQAKVHAIIETRGYEHQEEIRQAIVAAGLELASGG